MDLDQTTKNKYEIKIQKRIADFIKRFYQCDKVVQQPLKLRILKFYYDFMDTCINRKNYELVQIDKGNLYMTLSEKIIREDPVEEHHREWEKYLATA